MRTKPPAWPCDGPPGYTQEGTVKAVDNYSAVREDPKFVQAWAALAVGMLDLYFNGYDGARSTADAIRDAADTAARLQPDLAETLWARGGYLYWVRREYPAALDLFKRALEKQPGDVDMLASLFFVERRMGRWDDALAHYRETLARDPRDVSLRAGAAEILFWRSALRRAPRWRPSCESHPASMACWKRVSSNAWDVWMPRIHGSRGSRRKRATMMGACRTSTRRGIGATWTASPP